jgi:hypothetical protein
MNRCLVFLLIAVAVVLAVTSFTGTVFAAQDSYFILRLNGTVQPLPGMSSGNVDLMANNDYPEFYGFRVVNSQSGKRLLVGTWTLERDRRDRPDKGEKIIRILTFEVPPGSLVNLGTIDIVLEGDPKEIIRDKPDMYTGGIRTTGIYTYSYHYERPGAADDFTWPVNTLKERKSKIYEQYQGSIVEVKEPVTSDPDGSRIKLESVGN